MVGVARGGSVGEGSTGNSTWVGTGEFGSEEGFGGGSEQGSGVALGNGLMGGSGEDLGGGQRFESEEGLGKRPGDGSWDRSGMNWGLTKTASNARSFIFTSTKEKLILQNILFSSDTYL